MNQYWAVHHDFVLIAAGQVRFGGKQGELLSIALRTETGDHWKESRGEETYAGCGIRVIVVVAKLPNFLYI